MKKVLFVLLFCFTSQAQDNVSEYTVSDEECRELSQFVYGLDQPYFYIVNTSIEKSWKIISRSMQLSADYYANCQDQYMEELRQGRCEQRILASQHAYLRCLEGCMSVDECFCDRIPVVCD